MMGNWKCQESNYWIPRRTEGQAEHLENKLRDLVVGQDEAIHQIVRAYQIHLAGLCPIGRPIGNFLFPGPIGSGKACIVEATAESLLRDSRYRAPRRFLLVEGTDFRYGARHLKRAIERLLVQPLSNLMASGQINRGNRVRVSHVEGSSSQVFFREAEVLETWAVAARAA